MASTRWSSETTRRYTRLSSGDTEDHERPSTRPHEVFPVRTRPERGQQTVEPVDRVQRQPFQPFGAAAPHQRHPLVPAAEVRRDTRPPEVAAAVVVFVVDRGHPAV